jgi:hypothetical protein
MVINQQDSQVMNSIVCNLSWHLAHYVVKHHHEQGSGLPQNQSKKSPGRPGLSWFLFGIA